MSTLYEYYNTGDDSYKNIYTMVPSSSDYWEAQTFNCPIAHRIMSVKLALWRTSAQVPDGPVTVGIRNVDGDGNPSGNDLCSGTINVLSLNTSWPGDWEEITLGAGYELSSNTTYAIVVRLNGYGDIFKNIKWDCDQTTPTYSGGSRFSSSDGGSTWTADASRDFMFEEWGIPLVTVMGPRILKEDGDLLLKEDGDALLLEFGQWDIDIIGTVYTSDNIVKDVGLNKADTFNITDALSKGFGLIKAEAVAISESIIKAVSIVKADSVALADSLIKAINLVKAETVTISDSIVKAIGLIKAETVAITEGIVKTIGLIKVETLAISDSILKAISLVKADSMAIADTFSKVLSYVLSLADNVGITDSIRKAISLIKADTLTITDIVAPVIGAVAHIINLFDTVIISDRLEGVLRSWVRLRQTIARMEVKGMGIAKMGIKRMNIDKTPLYRWITRRWTA